MRRMRFLSGHKGRIHLLSIERYIYRSISHTYDLFFSGLASPTWPYGAQVKPLIHQFPSRYLWPKLKRGWPPALPAELLSKPPLPRSTSRGAHFSHCSVPSGVGIWQVLQANTSCRARVVRQVQALFALEGVGSVDEATGAYCQARSKIPLAVLEQALHATAKKAEQKMPLTNQFAGASR